MLICQGKSYCRKKTVNPKTFSRFRLWCQGLEERLVGTRVVLDLAGHLLTNE